MLTVAILSGGLATRLWPVTEKIPKALIAINGEPFVVHQLRLLARKGVTRVVFLLGHLGERVVEVVGDGSRFGMDIQYAFDGPILLGTAGAISASLRKLGDCFFVLYGDSYLECDFKAVQEAFFALQKSALMTVFRNEDQFDRSNVEMKGNQIIAYNKENKTRRMRHIDFGLGIFQKEVFLNVRIDAPTDLADIYGRLVSEGKLAALEVTERFFEVGSFDGINALTQHIQRVRQT